MGLTRYSCSMKSEQKKYTNLEVRPCFEGEIDEGERNTGREVCLMTLFRLKLLSSSTKFNTEQSRDKKKG